MFCKINDSELKLLIETLRKVSIFSATETCVLKEIAQHLHKQTIKDGERIFSKDDVGKSMYIIVSGSVKVHDGHHIFTTLETGQFFGEYSLLDSQVRSASVTALENSELLRLEQDVFFKLISKNIDVARSVFKSLLHRLYDKDKLEEQLAIRNSEILQQKEEIVAQRDEIEAQRDEIEAQRDEVIRQRDQIALQQKEITSSIRYASRIQTAALPTHELINKLLPEHFLIFRPRDIVSGDFYWVKKICTKNSAYSYEKVVVAAADCTGHGVPGAFTSMLGIALLNEIGHRDDIDNPAEMLNNLRENIIYSLNQTGKSGETNDGMDIAICIFDFNKNILQFAGANNPALIIRNQELIELKPDRIPIGISSRLDRPFSNHIFNLQKDDTIYIFSDGYVDQFGGSDGRKLYIRHFKGVLLSIQHLSLSEQKKFLEQYMNDWMACPNPHNKNLPYEQIDDILVIGIRV